MPEPMTAQELAGYKALADAATPGKWTVTEAEGYCNAIKCPYNKDREDEACEKCEDWRWTQGAFIDTALTIDCGEYDGMNDADARFCAASREAVPRLVAEVERLQAENSAYKADIEAGRSARIPEFPQDMDNILEPLKVQSALNSEVMKLNFRKEHKPKDVSILDYTIIAALYKVLDEARAALEKEDTHESIG